MEQARVRAVHALAGGRAYTLLALPSGRGYGADLKLLLDSPGDTDSRKARVRG